MANITQINPNTITNPQSFNIEDTTLMTSVITSSLFDIANDNIEYFVYDLNNNLINQQVPFTNWSVTFDPSLANSSGSISTINLSPEKDLNNLGYSFGNVKSIYNFISNKLGTSPNNKLFISEISSDRTEIRLKSNFISNDSLKIQYEDFKSQLESDQYFDEFYLNFGGNNYILSVNILLDESSSNYSLLIKLYEPLPLQYNTKSECYVIVKTAESIAYEVQFDDIVPGFNSVQIKPANFNIDELDLINQTSTYKNYSSITSTTLSGSLFQILNNLSGSNIDIPVDYSDYNNFVFFSSAAQRLSNFRSKLVSISSSQAQLNALNSSISGPTLSTNAVLSSKEVLEKQIQSIITNFDNYENYLYYQSSSYSWPKVNNNLPYVLYDVTSSQAINWYSNQLSTASDFDSNNQNYLYYSVPQYLRESSDNDNYLLFVDMIGQLFDQIWLYTNAISDKSNTSPGLDLGVSKDLAANILESLGVKLYGSNFTAENIYNSLIGLNPDGDILLPTGSELITNYVTSSISPSLVPTIDDYHKLTYKKIYHALPYLLKKKGTSVGLKALLNIFGIPDTILRINEFGGKDKNPNTWDYWQNEYDYAYKATGSYYISSSFSLNSTWGASDNVPGAVEFRFKAESIPPTNASQSLWYTDKGLGIFLEYTGSGLSTGSYSGSVVDSYNQYGTLKFISGTDSASVYLPFFNDGWWSVLINSSSAGYTLYAKNNTYSGNDGNTLGFQASSTLNVPTLWSGSTISYFVTSSGTYKGLSGSLQEIRYYTQPISESTFDAYVMNPSSIEQSQYLAFRAALGGELYTGSTSIHPKVSGTWITTSSFTGTSNFYTSSTPTYISNVETNFYDQPSVGIQNAVSSKIQSTEVILPPSNNKPNIPFNTVLSPFRTVQQTPSISSSYTNDVNYVEVAFSPQNEINEDIMSTLGYFNIGEYIGDPRQVSSSNTSYPALDALRDLYFEKYSSNYDWNDYLRLIKYFDNSLFKMLKDYTPAKASLASGVVIKQHLLERNKYPVPQLDFTQPEYTGSIEMYSISGSDGGALNITPIVTQSWTGVNDTVLGPVSFVHNTEDEFFNGIFSGSQLTVTDGELGYPISLNTIGSWQSGSLINVGSTTLQKIGFDFDYDQIYYVRFSYQIQTGTGTSLSLKDGLGNIFYTTPINNSGLTVTGSTDLIEVKNPFAPLGFIRNGSDPSSVKDVYISKYIIDAYDADPLLNNVLVNRPNPYYMDVDYASSQNQAINLQNILSGSGTRFAIPESNYTSFRSINPRYLGSKNSGQYNYSQFYASSSIAPGYPIDNFSNYFIYFDWIGGSSPQYPGGGNIHGIYLVDIEGNATPLTTDNKNLSVISNTFVKGNKANIFPAVYSAGSSSIQVEIIEGGALYETILISTGSQQPFILSSTDQGTSQGFGLYFNSSSLNVLNDSGSKVDNSTSWIYSLSNPSSSIGIIEYFYFSGYKGVSFFNKNTGQYVNDNTSDWKINYTDTHLPLQYGDFIRFGTTSSFSAANTSSLDGSFNAGGLFQIATIITSSNNDVSSSIVISPSINQYSFTQNVALSSINSQNFRIFRRIPNETFILVQNSPSYTDPGFLVPQNYNPKYDPYTLARKAGLIT
jgi:hypothetical protein